MRRMLLRSLIVALLGALTGGARVVFADPPLLAGVDVSIGSTSSAAYSRLRTIEGKQFVIVNALGSVSVFPAASNLAAARLGGIGLRAAYVFLNFNNQSQALFSAPPGTDQTGELQVERAFLNLGGEPIAFMAIDVEGGTPGAPTITLSRNDATRRIADAVQACRDRGVPALIYTNAYYWNTITGNTLEIQNVPLWHPLLQSASAPAPADLATGFVPFGPWNARLGRQYFFDIFLQGIKTDLNVFDSAAFSLPIPTGRPSVRVGAQTPIATRSGSNATIRLALTNTGSSDALACRVTGATLTPTRANPATLTSALPVKLLTLAPNGTANFVLSFANARAGANVVRLTGTYGGGTFAATFRVNL